MLPTRVRDHLINVRAAGLPLPDIYIYPGTPTARLSVHTQTCQRVLYDTVSDVANVPDEFRLEDCNACQDWQTATVTDWLDKLRPVAEDGNDFSNLVLHFLNEDGTLRDFEWDDAAHALSVCTQYVAFGRMMRPTRLYDGASCLENDFAAYADEMNPTYASLGEYSLEVVQDATLQWRRLAAHKPLRTHTIGVSPDPTDARIRAVANEDRLGNEYYDPDGQAHDDALRIEADRILVHDDWELIDWHADLGESSTAHSTADARGLSTDQLDQALTLYAISGADGAPLQDLVDAIAAAHDVS